MTKVGILGTGAFGLALAKLCYENKCDVMAWTKFEEEKNLILSTRRNDKVLPGINIEEGILITNDLDKIISFSEIIIVAIPVSFLENTLKEISNFDLSNKYFCFASKGILENNNLLIHEIFNKYISNTNFSIISGPSFASEIVTKTPIGLSIYASNDNAYNMVSNALCNNHFTLDRCNDLIGLELNGSIKNVIAIASGIINGLDYSDSTKALFLTRAINDTKEIIMSLGGMENTAYTLSGIGDMLLTCSSEKSRNFQFGYRLAKNREYAFDYLANTTVEGYHSLKSLIGLLKKNGIENKLISLIENIVLNDEDVDNIINYLI